MMNGLCYEGDKELKFNESSAVPALAPRRKQIHPSGYYLYGMGSLGTSAIYSQVMILIFHSIINFEMKKIKMIYDVFKIKRDKFVFNTLL